jgi:excinuclease UvrABC helicase subunit UvrB
LRDISASIKIEFDITEVNRSSKKITGILVFSSSILLYLVVISDSMNEAITETERRRSIQEKYNKEHGIIPKTIIKDIPEVISNETEKKVEKESKLSRKENNLIKNITIFKVYTRLTNKTNLKAGTYNFSEDMGVKK